MDRDTEEWLRPWTDEGAGGRVAAAPPEHPSDGPGRRRASSAAEGEAAGPTRAPGTWAGAVRVTRPGGTAAVDEGAPIGGRSSVRSDTPRSDQRSRPIGPPRTGPPPAGAGGGATTLAEGATGAGPAGRLRSVAVGVAAGLVGAVVGTVGTLVVVDGDVTPVAEDSATTTGAEEDDGTDAPEEVATGSIGDVADADRPGGGGGTVVSDVAAAVLPSVVRIDVTVERDDPDLGSVDVASGVGSGVVYSADGYVLTNNHVVDGADGVEVTFADGTTEEATVVGTDRLTDLAVLQVRPRRGLEPVTLRLDEPLRVGETAVAIGSPFGLDASVTAGVVSALNRDLQVPGDGVAGAFVIPATIQTDAAINPGNSGGALVDADGRLIGINTAILTNDGGSQGVGFAIPTAAVVAAADQLIEDGVVAHPFLGIAGLDVTDELAARYLEEFGIDLDGGAVVDEVFSPSGAADAGMEVGDVIVGFAGEEVAGMTDVIAAVLRYDVGDTVTVEVLREGERLTLEVTLGERAAADR